MPSTWVEYRDCTLFRKFSKGIACLINMLNIRIPDQQMQFMITNETRLQECVQSSWNSGATHPLGLMKLGSSFGEVNIRNKNASIWILMGEMKENIQTPDTTCTTACLPANRCYACHGNETLKCFTGLGIVPVAQLRVYNKQFC